MNKQENNYAFIDSQNLNLGIRDAGWRLDFARFNIYLRDKYHIAKSFLFIGYVAGVDAELVLHAMIQYQNYDKAIVVSGDGDFHCLVEYLERQKKLARVLIPNHKKYSALLRRFMPFIEYLDGLERKLGRRQI